jgi:hypothetical protein
MKAQMSTGPAPGACAQERRSILAGLLLAALLPVTPASAQNPTGSVVGWNNLGMHCMDSDFSVFSILPPYNTVNAQVVLVTNGTAHLVTDTNGYTVTYQAVADPDGSINHTSVGKANFWDYSVALFGAALAPDQGLPVPGRSFYMPGTNNTPQNLDPENPSQWFAAYGIPITPYDDSLRKNAYPLMRLIAYQGNQAVATNDVVLPVSDEMDCRACHGSGRPTAAQPAAGWVWEPDPDRDQRLNVLRRHDEARGSTNAVYLAALATNGYQQAGLFPTVLSAHKAILCARCHRSEALPGSGRPGIPPLTQAVHARHATVHDPDTGVTLDSDANRTACYRCHPGAVTRCLRGAMGKAAAADGTPAMQCQSCHGKMSDVGSGSRTGWLQEPNCQACHTGTALNNAGQIRYTSVFSAPGVMRTNGVAATFATNPNTPGPNLSLYRFSRGHGGLYCSACHGSTHAEFPTTHRNDNLYSLRHQKHVGVLAECTSCHGTSPLAVSSGPHGLHPLGQSWVTDHHDSPNAQCAACHGINGEGTVLCRAHTARTLTASFDGGPLTRQTWRGYQFTCYTCHLGANNSNRTSNQAPTVPNRGATTGIDTPLALGLTASDPDGPQTPVLRIITQPDNGTVALVGTNATYQPFAAFAGTDTFTYAAFDSQLDSNLGTVTVTVVDGPCTAISSRPRPTRSAKSAVSAPSR